MSNEHTRKQIADSLERMHEKMLNPDPKEKIKRERKEKSKRVAKSYGF